jgi:hypothetical protein
MALFLLIGFCAAAASVLLFVSLTSGSPMALMLAQLAPLPILIAGLGWSHWCAILAVLIGAVAMGAYFGIFFFLVFALTIGVPAWWLSYLALLARPGLQADALDWYPPQRMIIWSCLIAAAVTTAGLIKIAGADSGFEASLRSGFERFLRLQTGTPAPEPLRLPGVTDVGHFLDLLVLVIPAAAAATAAVANILNLWLAGRAVDLSGRLKRPWPDLAALRLPPLAAVAFAITLAGSLLLPGFVGAVCRVVTATLAVACVVVGLAVVHTLVRAFPNRLPILLTVYVVIAIFQWPLLVLLAIGLADAVTDIRTRFVVPGGPPRSPTA